MSGGSDLYFEQIPVGEMANLAYLVGSRETREVLLVDPAWSVDALFCLLPFHQSHQDGVIPGHGMSALVLA